MSYGISFETSVFAADDLVQHLVSVYPELADPRNVHLDLKADGNVVEESWVEFPLLFNDLIDRALGIEAQYAKTGYMLECGAEYCCVSRPNRNGDIVSSMCAVVTKGDGAPIILDPDRPIIFGLIGANPQRTLGERISVQSYLVRVFCQFVGRPGFTVGRLGQLVGVLRELVRLACLDKRDDSADTAEASHESAETAESADFIPCPLKEGNDFMHMDGTTAPADGGVR